MEETAYDIRQVDTLAAWQQALAEVPQTPALSGALLRRRDDLFGRFVAWYGRLRSRPRAERRRWQRQLGLSLAGIALLLAVNGAPVGAVGPAATIIVTNGTSTVANGDGCSLPEAITNSNNDDQSGSTDCAAGTAPTPSASDQRDPDGGEQLDLGPTGLPAVVSAITIEGNNQTISRQSGSPGFRIMAVGSGGNLTLNNATVSGVFLFLAQLFSPHTAAEYELATGRCRSITAPSPATPLHPEAAEFIPAPARSQSIAAPSPATLPAAAAAV